MQELLSEQVERKFIDVIDIEDDEWEIETDTGFSPISHINKTVKYQKYILKTTNEVLECADTHIVFDENLQEVFVKDLVPGDSVTTKNGIEQVVSVQVTEDYEEMYDLTVADDNHRYYTGNILSHNTTTTAAYFCWLIIFKGGTDIGILANKALLAKEILDRIKLAYETLPKFLQQGVKTWNKSSIEVENGSRIIASSTSSSAVRGYTFNYVYLDEFAFVPPNIADDFFQSVYPTISSGKNSKIFISSTPNGYNHFYKIWNDAITGQSNFVPVEMHWTEVPGRTQEWKDNIVKTLGEDRFLVEFDNQFLGSAGTLIPSRVIQHMSADRPIESTETYKKYFEPEDDRKYVIVCDPARGTGNDYSAFIVFDVTEYPIEIAATFKDNQVSPNVLPTILAQTAYHYNNADVLIEINDNGQQVAEILFYDLEYDNTVFLSFHEHTPGIRTTHKVKRLGCANFKDLAENQKLIINDLDLIAEISTFVAKKAGYEAEQGSNDDLVMCCVLLGWFMSTTFFENINDLQFRQRIRDEKQRMIEDEVLPFGFIDDGTVNLHPDEFLDVQYSTEEELDRMLFE